MEFITEGDTVKCVRFSSTYDEKGSTTVATFHIDVDRVAPHVAASLTPDEIEELELWLKDRAKLHEALEERPIQKTIVETLPEVIRQAVVAIEELGGVNKEVHQAIKHSLASLTSALDETEVLESEKQQIDLEKMPNSEVLKEKLKAIKENIKKHK